METSQQLSLALASIAITILGISITLMVQWAALPKKNQVRNLAFWSSIILFIAGLSLVIKSIHIAWGFRDVIELIVGIALGVGIALTKERIQKKLASKRR